MSDPAIAPFFILGAPRTGTTLLRRILNAHPVVAIPPEALFVYDFLTAKHVPLETRKRMLCGDPALRSWDLRLTEEDLAPCETMGACLDRLHQKYAESEGKSAWGHKTPGLVLHTNLLSEAFPRARFLHTVRDPRAVANSLKRSSAHRLNVLYGAARYARDTRIGLDLERREPERARRVRFEDLVTRPLESVTGVCEWLGIDFDPAMLESLGGGLKLDAAETRESHHDNIVRPIDPAIARKWSRQLSSNEISVVESVTGDLMRELDYESTLDGASPGSGARLGLTLRGRAMATWMILRNLWARPRLLAIVRRKWRLGTLMGMAKDKMGGM